MGTLLAFLLWIAFLALVVWLVGKLLELPKPDPRELVVIAIPVLAEVVAVILFIGMIAVVAALRSGA